MTHPLVTQLRFTRSEFRRVMDGVTAEEAVKRLEPMNCISWMVAHLANHEQDCWITLTKGIEHQPYPELRQLMKEPTTPPWDMTWSAWEAITAEADEYLETVTTEILQTHFSWRGEPVRENVGTMMQRLIYHYWFHVGEAHAVRQMLGHQDLPQFVGRFEEAVYRPETD